MKKLPSYVELGPELFTQAKPKFPRISSLTDGNDVSALEPLLHPISQSLLRDSMNH